MTGSAYCLNHDPDAAEARKRRASKGGKRGGRGRPLVELANVKTRLEDLTGRVLSGDLETGRAAVANQLLNTRLRALEVERRWHEADELEARIATLERSLDGAEARRAWEI